MLDLNKSLSLTSQITGKLTALRNVQGAQELLKPFDPITSKPGVTPVLAVGEGSRLVLSIPLIAETTLTHELRRYLHSKEAELLQELDDLRFQLVLSMNPEFTHEVS